MERDITRAVDCTVKIQLLHPDAVLPHKANPLDACFDVVAVSRNVTEDYIEYGLGFATEFPEGWQGLFYARSSVSNYSLMLKNGVAIIDAGYRGEWKARFYRTAIAREVPVGGWVCGQPTLTKTELQPGFNTYKIGDRIGQIQFQRVPQVLFEAVDSLSDSVRGTGGFGSTECKVTAAVPLS
ncbi:dUTP diphosphatase [Hymenobacter sp. BT491]|uniref:dUTP diphosphatase n=1 Tax=Hymenobacter sp. BT491 TaxID=2766779 RepID=UPI00165364DA|nr:dUTP diphosphatase [Hymenobacter sp. BT491]MBC6988970.1 dUTP diphosphatase [Hymenobacter sp. BT491]